MEKVISKKILIVFEHVLGATIAEDYLKSKGMNVSKDQLPKEGDAKLWVDENDYDEAKLLLEQWKEEVQRKFNMMT